MKLENVVGVCIGNKVINGINTFEICINVLVKNKINIKYLSENNVIPKSYMGIKTDVIEVGILKHYMDDRIVGKFRPLVSGCQIDVKDYKGNYSMGTLGGIVYKTVDEKKEYYILSNNHVLCNYGEFPIGTPIIQSDSENYDDIVAHLTTFVPIKLSKENDENDEYLNSVDAGIAKLTSKELVSTSVSRIGKISGIGNAKLGDIVRKVGAISGVTHGSVIGLGGTVDFGYSDEEYMIFKDQIFLGIEGSPGDSGALVFNEKNEVIGMLMGGDDIINKAFVNDINIVLNELKVNLYID